MMPRHSEPAPPAEPAFRSPGRFGERPRRILLAVVLTGVALFYLSFLWRNAVSYGTDSDTSGYVNIARLIRAGHLVGTVPQIDRLAPPDWDYINQQPLGFRVDSQHGRMVPTYPVGLPLHLAAAASVVGLRYAPLATSLGMALAAAALMIALGRQLGLPWTWSLAGAAILWACPLVILHEIEPMSDVPAMVWTLACLWSVLRARDRWPWGFAAGFALAIAVLVRPSDLVLLAPIAIALGWRWRAWLAFGLGGLPGAIFLVWYNLKLYGTALTTGYGDVSELLRAAYVPHNALHFALWLPALLSPLVIVAALAWPVVQREKPVLVAIFAAWAAVIVGFYLFYLYSGQSWWYVRFLLPMFPAVIAAALLAGHGWCSRIRSPQWRTALPALALAFVLAWQVTGARKLAVNTQQNAEHMYRRTVEWMQAHAPTDAIVAQMQLSGCFTCYTHFPIVRWDIVKPAEWARLCTEARAAHRPIYATLFDFEEKQAFPDRLPGHWELLTRIDYVSIWRLVDAPVSAPR